MNQMAKPDLSDYNEVADRVKEFHAKYPEGTLRADHDFIKDADGKIVMVVVKAYAYRTPDDPMPASGLASEPVPGKTPYTKDSELMNAETSAWGRAIVAVGASTAKKIASRDEVLNRQVPTPSAPTVGPGTMQAGPGLAKFFAVAPDHGGIPILARRFSEQFDGLHPKDAADELLLKFVSDLEPAT